MGKQLFHLVAGAPGAYTGAMNSNAATSPDGPPAWSGLDALPRDLAAAGRDLPLAIAAWVLADPAVAAELFVAWLATADADGVPTPACCPVVCQLAERVAAVQPDPAAWVARHVPALAACLRGEFERYDPDGTGLPRWPSAAEALFPAEFAPGRVTADLAVLLSNEAAAFDRLAGDRTDLERTLDEAEGEQRELDSWLKESFWNPEASAFDREEADGVTTPDWSPAGLFPLVWGGLAEDMAVELRLRAANLDPAAWPARAWTLFFALLLKTPHGTAVARMRRAGLPAGASPPVRAAWEVLAQGVETARAPYLAAIPRSARWVDAHGRAFARGAAAAGAVLLAGLLVRGCVQRENPGAESANELERRARIACADGRHARAAALYAKAARRGDAVYFGYRQAGEWMHLEQYAEAEAAYRAVLARAPETPNARLNLALAVLRQGRRAEARELYRAFADDPAAAATPELAARARLATVLLERQLALDRE
jgi:tetratricopeptide (TPR) repeat protein